jgi:hypothetical protein
MGDRLTIFVAYSPDDAALKNELLEHLSVLERFKNVEVWTTDLIPAGADRASEIDQALDRADVALLLVSSSWLATLTKDTELFDLLKRRTKEGLTIIPVILRACDWRADDLISGRQVLPRSGEPIKKYTGARRDAAFKEVALAISDLTTSRPRKPTARDGAEVGPSEGGKRDSSAPTTPRRMSDSGHENKTRAPASESSAPVSAKPPTPPERPSTTSPEPVEDGLKFSFKFKRLRIAISLTFLVPVILLVWNSLTGNVKIARYIDFGELVGMPTDAGVPVDGSTENEFDGSADAEADSGADAEVDSGRPCGKMIDWCEKSTDCCPGLACIKNMCNDPDNPFSDSIIPIYDGGAYLDGSVQLDGSTPCNRGGMQCKVDADCCPAERCFRSYELSSPRPETGRCLTIAGPIND